jgi:hypothetical protein
MSGRWGQSAVGKKALLTFIQMLAGYVHFVALSQNWVGRRRVRGAVGEAEEWLRELGKLGEGSGGY